MFSSARYQERNRLRKEVDFSLAHPDKRLSQENEYAGKSCVHDEENEHHQENSEEEHCPQLASVFGLQQARQLAHHEVHLLRRLQTTP